jgi:hypothetical protein
MNIENDYHAYCFDEAVATWGNHVVSELESIEGKNAKETAKKQKAKLLALLDVPIEKRFRSMRGKSGVTKTSNTA